MPDDGLTPETPESAPEDSGFQARAGVDQGASDSDQTSADFDQTLSDIDQSASERDQRAADRDQRAADRDQAEADHGVRDAGPREQVNSEPSAQAESGRWADTRRARSQSTIDRDISSHARRESARARDLSAERRDADADVRDQNAKGRDELAAALDVEMAALEASDIAGENDPHSAHQRALRARRSAAGARSRAAQSREAAAWDRVSARSDRLHAADDRQAAQVEIALEGVDHLTGALRRGAGFEGLARELERSRRTHEPLIVAFVDVDGLKEVNDTYGHADGDLLLAGVAGCIKRVLRPYDLIMRYGGDEFVCVLSGQSARGIDARFTAVAGELAAKHHGASITVGFAEAREQDSPEQLIVRADESMIAVRRNRRGADELEKRRSRRPG